MANDHKWNDELTDGKLKEEALMHKARIEESQGDATPGVMKFCAWLKSSFENFHELDYDVLVKMEECWWKVNAHENAPFARWENHSQGPYANAKTKKDYDPYLDIYRNFGRNYGSNNAGIMDRTTQVPFTRWENHSQGPYANAKTKKDYDPYLDIYRNFGRNYGSNNAEREHSDHSRINVDACQAYRELFRIMDEGWLVTKAKEE
ncbi:hypothetical protein Tco_0681932 [Tanacetum coccineum]|uniref:EDS1 EP domain-containing protein n=1 Tax=Tanacetum coccineum TaxID=301880 RepID=A0ABQ4XRM1_9ASTR